MQIFATQHARAHMAFARTAQALGVKARLSKSRDGQTFMVLRKLLTYTLTHHQEWYEECAACEIRIPAWLRQ